MAGAGGGWPECSPEYSPWIARNERIDGIPTVSGLEMTPAGGGELFFRVGQSQIRSRFASLVDAHPCRGYRLQ